MTEPLGPAKVLFTGASAGLLYAAGVSVADLPLPAPSVHNTLEAAMIAVMAWMVREVKVSKQQPKDPSGPSGQAWTKILMDSIAACTESTQEVAKELKEHRLEFADFRGDANARFRQIDQKFTESRHGK